MLVQLCQLDRNGAGEQMRGTLRIKWSRMFKSRTILEHLVRGALGFGALALAFTYGPHCGWCAALPLVAALVCFRG